MPEARTAGCLSALLIGCAAKYPGPGAASTASVAATAPAASAEPAASRAETADAPQAPVTTAAAPARPPFGPAAASRRPAAKRATQRAADPPFPHGPLAVLDGDGCAYGVDGIVLDCPATAMGDLVERTLHECGLGAPQHEAEGAACSGPLWMVSGCPTPGTG